IDPFGTEGEFAGAVVLDGHFLPLDREAGDLDLAFRIGDVKEIARDGDVRLEGAAAELGVGKKGLEELGEIREADGEGGGVRDVAVPDGRAPREAMRSDLSLPAHGVAVEGMRYRVVAHRRVARRAALV